MVPPSSLPSAAGLNGFAQRVACELDALPARLPVVLGGCGSGRTTMLRQVQGQYGERACQYIDVERTATTPERFCLAMVAASPFTCAGATRTPAGPREAYDLALAFLRTAQTADGRPAMFLLDEAFELRTFESFPGLRHAVREFLDALAMTGNRVVLASRYEARARRLLEGRPPPYVLLSTPGLTTGEIGELLRSRGPDGSDGTDSSRDEGRLGELAHAVCLLSDGRPAYADAMATTMREMRAERGGDPVSALTALLSPGGRLAARCAHSYEIRLHRARGYGALKAILEVLSDREALTLTEVSRALRRTPGSTKDYLSWLEDVDLVAASQKRYAFRDPLLRLWVRLYCRSAPPGDEVIAGEVQRYAQQRLRSGGLRE